MKKFYIYGMAALLGAATIMQSCSDDDVVTKDEAAQIAKDNLLTADQINEIIQNGGLSKEEIEKLLDGGMLTDTDINSALEADDRGMIDKEYHTVGYDTLSDYLDSWNGGRNAYIRLEDVTDDNIDDAFQMFYDSEICGHLDLSDCKLTSVAASISGNSGSDGNNIASLVFPEGMKSIPAGFAGYNQNIKSVTFNKGITEIPYYTFYNCTNLTSVTLPEGLTKLGNQAFLACLQLKNIVLPSTLETIGPACFGLCIYLDSLTIPASIKTIGNSAFLDCVSLKTVTFLGAKTDGLSVSRDVFEYCADDLKIYCYALDMADYLHSVNSSWKILLVAPDGTMTNYDDLNAGK